MARKNTVPKPSGETVICPHCGSVNSVDHCPTFNGHDANGLFCSTCRGPLSQESVESHNLGSVNNAQRDGVREHLREKVAATGF